MASGSGGPAVDEGHQGPARAATETLAELYEEHAHDLYATFTPVQWASWLHDTADVHRTDWFHLASLVLLSRALSHRDTIARLTDADRIAFCDYTGRILRLLEDDSAAHCMAAQVNGQRCPYRSGNGLPYCKRHSNHGLPLLAHDDDGATGHGHSYVCFGCGQPSDDHPTDSEEADGVYTFNCTTCAASIAAACAAETLGADLPSDARVICDCCSGVRDRWGLILTDAVTESGEPAVPQYYRLPVQPDLLPTTITARSTRRLNTPRVERAPARGLADGITPARLPLATPTTRTPTPAPATARAAAPRPRAPVAYEPAARPAPFTLTSADYNKLVEAVAALTGKVDQVVKENRTLRAQAQAGAPRAVPAAPKPPPEAAPGDYMTPAELLSSTGATAHRWGNTACRTYIKSYQGSKDHLDACGRAVSSPLHYANRAYGAQLDLLAAKPTDDKARQWHELQGYQPPANSAQTYPDRHHLEAYHVNMLTWHWELLHVVDSPLFDNSPDGERRVETILSVTGRIRFMHAVQKACEYGDGGPALSWPSVYAYMQRYHRAFLVSRELCLFDQWFPQLQAKQLELLHKGAAPHLHDDLQRQLISAARGNLNTSWLDELRGTMSRPHAQHPHAPSRNNPNPAPSIPKACAYCLGDHKTSQHPAEEPITQPCPSSPLPALLLRKFGIDHALLVVRTCAAASVHIPAAYADLDGADCMPIYSADGTAYQKLMLAQLAAGLGLTAAPLRAPEAELQAFLDGLRIVRRSFKPSGAREAANRRYLELGCRGDSAPPTLTWTVPPGHAAGWAEWYRGQAGIDDSIRGVYTPGLRVNTAALLMSPHVPSDLKAQLLEGAPLLWTGRPPRSRKNNYKSCFDNNNAAGVDFDRIIALGFCEGPLHYLPWIVNPIACIIKTVPTYKVRNVVDFKQSGVNDCLARVSCQLSDIHGVLESLQPGDALGKIDLTDAFFCWPTSSSDCDYQGLQHPATGEYYRYRYVPFGNRQAPALQQRWAHVIRDILLREGLQFCVPGSPEASYANFGVAGTYLDDFLLKFNSSLSLWQHGLMYLSCVNTLNKYGLPVKLAKNEWPSTRCEFVGVLIDTVRGTVAVSAARGGKLRARADALLTEVDVTGTTARGALASFIGKVQWTCPVVLPGQAHLVGLYRARDCLVSAASTNSIDSWDPAEPCSVDPAARADLLWWRDTLAAGASRMTPSPSDPIQPLERSYRRVPAFPGLWSKAMIPRLPGDPQLPLDGSAGFEVVTSDASGWAGGVWWGDVRLHYAFTPEQLQQWSTSANLRELFMVPWTIAKIGARLAGSSVLFRLDNTSSVGAVNKGASPHPDSLELLLWLLELLERYDIALIARHIPGRKNTLADSLSRLRGAIDDQDWRLLSDIFRALEAACGPFDVDACADPLGRNSFCPAFWSAIDSCLAHDWAGRRVYCNPPFAAMRDVLRHFWACYATAPSTTAGTFVLPVWAAAPWWRLTGGAQVIAYFRRGHALFTSPEWRDASRTNPVPSRRGYRGPTTWGVVLIHVPPAGPIDSLSAQATIAMPRLSGDGPRDLLRLRQLQDGFVRPVRRTPGHRDA
eukprot:jgi/Tetstr1/459544/TSEL_004909.t1